MLQRQLRHLLLLQLIQHNNFFYELNPETRNVGLLVWRFRFVLLVAPNLVPARLVASRRGVIRRTNETGASARHSVTRITLNRFVFSMP